MTGFTCKHEDIGLALVPVQYRSEVRDVFKASDIKANGYITIAISLPKKIGTDAQNRAFHALLGEFWASGLSSYESYEDMRDTIKLRIAGADEYIYIDGGRIRHVKTLDEVKGKYAEVPKSWADFTRDQRKEAIDWVIKEAQMAGINTRKWDEIIEGMIEEKII
jgi:methionine salvage enolase-phosphatase E1